MYDNNPANYGEANKADRAVSPIEEAHDRLCHRIEQGHEVCSKLEQRLESVLRPVPPEPNKAGELAEVAASPLHSRLMSSTRNAEGLVSRLSALLERLVV